MLFSIAFELTYVFLLDVSIESFGNTAEIVNNTPITLKVTIYEYTFSLFITKNTLLTILPVPKFKKQKIKIIFHTIKIYSVYCKNITINYQV